MAEPLFSVCELRVALPDMTRKPLFGAAPKVEILKGLTFDLPYLAWELDRVMKEPHVSQAELARRMKTSRAVVHRLLDATDPSVTLATISKAATALGRSVRVALAA